MKKTYLCGLGLLVTAGLLTGCGGGDDACLECGGAPLDGSSTDGLVLPGDTGSKDGSKEAGKGTPDSGTSDATSDGHVQTESGGAEDGAVEAGALLCTVCSGQVTAFAACAGVPAKPLCSRAAELAVMPTTACMSEFTALEQCALANLANDGG
jgi:hypothetical protein